MARSALLCFALTASACTRYHAAPIEPARSLEDFEARSLSAPELATYMAERGEAVDAPSSGGARDVAPRAAAPQAGAARADWDLHALTLAAFFYSPALDVARAQWGVAQGAIRTAGGRPNPTATAALGYNTTTDASTITPWIPEGTLEIPIEVAGKRGIRIAEARERSESARLALLTTAWQVRSDVRAAYLEMFVAGASDSLLARQVQILEATSAILASLREAGEVSSVDVTRARVDLANARVAQGDALARRAAARGALARAVGVPPAALDDVDFGFGELAQASLDLPAQEARRRAILNRTDILGSLADYEASQRALQLEVRKQYPDFSLGPGYQLDQTDSKWTLALSLVLPFFNRNQGPIAEAAARREEAASRFLELQSTVLANLETAVVAAGSAVAQMAASDTLLAARQRQERTSEAAYQAGEISRLELLGLQAETVATALARVSAIERAQTAIGALEDAMQSPIDPTPWVIEAPSRTTAQETGR